MKIARIFRHTDGLIYVQPEEAAGLDSSGPGHASKAEAIRAAIKAGYTHGKGSGTYQGNTVSHLSATLDPRTHAKRQKAKNEVKRRDELWRDRPNTLF